ncbi:hypothetical protein ACFWVM_28945 [Nocardia fluminea]|uniref:hypothetical protein n=1 Tax=Nocardia fluminea TaxID=134984 RepID=UPI003648A9D1
MAATKRARKSPATESRWSQLVREAKKDLPVHEPYVFDAVDPPVLIDAPDGLERSLALARLLEASEDSAIENLIPMLEALVGEDAFALVWSALRNEPIEVALALIDDIGEHFNGKADEGAEQFPGGEQAS